MLLEAEWRHDFGGEFGVMLDEDSFNPRVEKETESAAIEFRSYVGKRLFDVLGAVVLALLMLPFIAIIALAIRISGSPVIFSHTRIGRGRQPFRCYKFRTMIPDAEEVLQELLNADAEVLQEWRANHKIQNDPRVTRAGRFLRRSSLDELPQLWNVLKGDMSLVGPRPIVLDELDRYGNKALEYCSVRPGMTGLWQVLGRSNVRYSRRVVMDILYIRNQSLRMDIWIAIKTVAVVLRRAGAF